MEKVSEEVAIDEFNRFIELMDIDTDSDDDDDSFDGIKRVMVRAIQQGKLTVDEDGLLTMSTVGGESYSFKEPTGAMLQTIDSKSKKDGEVARLNRLLGAMSGVGPKPFADMKMRDYKVVKNIAILFLA